MMPVTELPVDEKALEKAPSGITTGCCW